MNFYKELEAVLYETDAEKKLKLFEFFYMNYKNRQIIFEHDYDQKSVEHPSYDSFCQIIAAQDVPKRKNLTTSEGQIFLLHAIAHIEYSAIDLALDAAYRFHNLPIEYYTDWLEVAADEVRHFLMLQELLVELGSYYGAVAVHNSLFEAMAKTQNSFLERMAIVPRYLEANGLDATPLILNKLKKLPENEMLSKIRKALQVIVNEEVSHVQKGDKWFTYACKQEGKDKNVYFEIIEKYYPLWLAKKKELNIEGRKQAGFTCEELQTLGYKDICQD
ncbi:MAG: ferritin-like domain-containing protein [Thiovulaceae bacterium]|nr:ferritin-like domain-containing protein [Sulfurimonadaceae bacterium]